LATFIGCNWEIEGFDWRPYAVHRHDKYLLKKAKLIDEGGAIRGYLNHQYHAIDKKHTQDVYTFTNPF
jgi:hypothetical protein